HQPSAEVILPDPIDNDARGEWMVMPREPPRQRKPASGAFTTGRRQNPKSPVRVQGAQDARRNFRPGLLIFAAPQEVSRRWIGRDIERGPAHGRKCLAVGFDLLQSRVGSSVSIRAFGILGL